RKALAAGIKEFGIDGAMKSNPQTRKVIEIVAEGTKNFAYHHGDQIFGNVICKMTRNHLGTNNVPWFHPASKFGSIDDNSKPAPRYAHVGPAWWWNYIYNNDDMR